MALVNTALNNQSMNRSSGHRGMRQPSFNQSFNEKIVLVSVVLVITALINQSMNISSSHRGIRQLSLYQSINENIV